MSAQRQEIEQIRNGDTLPPADQIIRLNYEGLWTPGAFVTLRVYRVEGSTFVVATDESDEHQNTSVTNRIERVMYLAWERLGFPWPCHFAEHYRGRPGGVGMFAEEVDIVRFDIAEVDHKPKLEDCLMSGKVVGPQFCNPDWKAIASFIKMHPEFKALTE